MSNQLGSRDDQPGKKRFFYGYMVAAAGFIIWMVGFGMTGTFGIFYIPIMTDFGWNRADMVFAFSLSTFLMAVLSILTGWLTDRLGPRIVVTIFGSFLGISFMLISRMTSLWQFIGAYGIIASIGLSVTSTPIMATVARWFEKRRGLMTGIVQAGLGVGGIVIVPFAGWLISDYGWRAAFWILGLISLLGVLLPGLFLIRDPRDVGTLPDGDSNTKNQNAIAALEELPAEKITIGAIMISRRLWIIAGLYAIFGFCRSTFIAHTAAHVQDSGYTLIDASNVVAVLMASSIIGRIGMGRIADAIGSRRAFMISYFITTLSLVWILKTGELWGLYLFAFIFGFGWGAQAVLRFSITAENFGINQLGLIIGILGIAEALVSALGSYLAGFIFDVLGHYRPAFWAGIGLSILGIILAWRSRLATHSLD